MPLSSITEGNLFRYNTNVIKVIRMTAGFSISLIGEDNAEGVYTMYVYRFSLILALSGGV